MEKYIINGGNKLYGSIEIQSAKNSVLPILGYLKSPANYEPANEKEYKQTEKAQLFPHYCKNDFFVLAYSVRYSGARFDYLGTIPFATA